MSRNVERIRELTGQLNQYRHALSRSGNLNLRKDGL